VLGAVVAVAAGVTVGTVVATRGSEPPCGAGCARIDWSF
jgi:hypothetical protein